MPKKIEHRCENGLELKWCWSCKEWKNLSFFRKNVSRCDGYSSRCKECDRCDYALKRQYRNASSKLYKEKHKKEIAIYNKGYWERNKDILRPRGASRNLKRYHNQLKGDIEYKIHAAMKSRIWRNLCSGRLKTPEGSSETLLREKLNYDYRVLLKHLELQFEDWMTLDNYGRGEGHWSIDHIDPISSFSITSVDCDDFKKCWSLDNLRPLDDTMNVSKKHYLLPDIERNAAKEKSTLAALLSRTYLNAQ